MKSINDLNSWVKRMNKLMDGDIDISNLSKYIANNCIYGEQFFCDGTPNGTLRKPPETHREKCKYLIDGKCALELHKGSEVKK